MLRLATQLNLRLLTLFSVSFVAAAVVLWKGETKRATDDVETLLKINYRDVSTGFTDRADFQLISIAREIARRHGSSGRISPEEVAAICAEEEIAELYDIDSQGVVVGGSRLVGEKVHGEQWSEFLRLLDPDGPESFAQPDRPRTSDGKVFKYAAARYPDNSGYVEVGWSEERFLKYLRQRAYGYTRSWHIDERGYIVFVDGDGIVVSHADMSLAGKTLKEATGLDLATVHTGALFRATIGGMEMFCYAGHVRNYLAILADPVADAFASRDRFMPHMAAILLVVFVSLFALVSLMLRNHVSRSVIRVGNALRNIAGGNLDGRVDERSSREFADLSDNINTTVEALRAAVEERVRRMEAELELAKTIQDSALPRPLADSPFFNIAADMQTAREVGGDFYDFFMLDSSHVAFLVADVSGKGITAALYMMTAKTLIKNALLAVRDPAGALTRANSELCANNPANMFLTAWVGVLDLETGIVTYANAGHNPPMKVEGHMSDAEGQTSKPSDHQTVTMITGKSGPVLAFMDGASYKPRTVALAPGDTLFLYTDGVTEAQDSQNTLFGEERLANTLIAASAAMPASMCTIVRAAVAAFAEGMPQADDITVLATRYISRPDRFVRSFPPTQEGVASASDFLDEVIEGHGGRKSGDGHPNTHGPSAAALLPQLHIFLDEIASNIVKHSDASGFEVDIELMQDPAGVKLVFIDDGAPYDPLAHADPDTSLPADERPIGGLGIMMVRKMSNSMSYERVRNRNLLTVVKLVS